MPREAKENEAAQPADGMTMTASGLEGLAGRLRALANPKRLHLLHYLARPHTIEEISSELKVARQTAQEHLQILLEIGLVERGRARGDHGFLSDFVMVPRRLFSIQEEFGRLGSEDVDPDGRIAGTGRTEPLDPSSHNPQQMKEPRLLIVRGRRVGEAARLSGGGPWTIGRDVDSSLCLDYDPFASSRHAEVRREGSRFVVADLYSSNGTFLDWQRLARGGAGSLVSGSVVQVGKTLLVFRSE